jgi:hypothetical protein
VITANPFGVEKTGAYLEVNFPVPIVFASYRCEAIMEFEEIICRPTGAK